MDIRVYGDPIPQGSTRAFAVRKAGQPTGRVAVTHDNAKTKPWRQAIAVAWLDQYPGCGFDSGPVSVSITFLMRRPRGHYGTGRNAAQVRAGAPACPEVKPDLDKLARAVLDALGDAGAWRDDAQVCDLSAGKIYAPEGIQPGAIITAERWKVNPDG